MQTQTQEVMSLVRKSEEETEKVRLEKMSIMQKWTTAVINLSKRDEALESFRNAMKKQELALKNVKAEIDGTKEEIINFQEKHEHLTTLRFDFFNKKMGLILQLNKYETAPNFIQLNETLTSDCLLI